MSIIPLAEHPVQALRRALLAHGYQPVAVYTGQKRPWGTGWQARRGMPPFVPDALNTGILCRGVRAVDIDIDDPILADRAAEIAEKIFGPTPLHRYRVGSARRLLLYLGDGVKRSVEVEGGKIEILGNGQQFVAYGQHPDGGHFEWRGCEPASHNIR